LLAEYLKTGNGDRLAAAIYGGSLLLMSLAFIAMHRQVLANPDLLDEHITEEHKRWLMRRNAIGLTPYILATAGAILSPYVTLAICTLVAIFYALPATTPDPAEATGP
jgi:uncharacterized membrane protein